MESIAKFGGVSISRPSNQERIQFRTVLGAALRSGKDLRKSSCFKGGEREEGNVYSVVRSAVRFVEFMLFG